MGHETESPGRRQLTRSTNQKTRRDYLSGLALSGQGSNLARRWIEALYVKLACWEILPAAMAVFLTGWLRHD